MMAFTVQGIDHVVLRVVDVEAMIRFYQDVLGCAVERRKDDLGLIQLRAGRSLIDLVDAAGELGRKGGGAPGAVVRNIFIGEIFGLALAGRSHPSAMFFLGGAVFYLVGTFLVTMLGNVPLNDQLAAVSVADPSASDVWEYYLERWTIWNHVRTVAAMVAALLFTLGLMQNATV